MHSLYSTISDSIDCCVLFTYFNLIVFLLINKNDQTYKILLDLS
jgi:hypothetical protein